MTIEYKTFVSLELKGEQTGQFDGYAATFSKDSQGDRILPGAFGKTIADRKGKIPIFMGHDTATWAGSSTGLSEDGKGLKMDAQLYLGTTLGRDAWGTLQGAKAAGFPTGLSIGFIPKDWEWDANSETRLIKEADLWEVSITPWPANKQARVASVKSIRDFERYVRDATKCSAEVAKELIAAWSSVSLAGASDRQTNAPRDARALTGNELLEATLQRFGR